jgi:hypothetical protein
MHWETHCDEIYEAHRIKKQSLCARCTARVTKGAQHEVKMDHLTSIGHTKIVHSHRRVHGIIR